MVEPSSTSRAKMSAILIGIATIVAFALVVFLEREPTVQPLDTPVDSLPGTAGALKPAPDLTVEALDGRSFQLSNYRGKVLVLDFWASWCGPCRSEIPILKSLAEEHHGPGFEVVGLTIEDPAREGDNVRKFVKELRINYSLGYATDELFGAYVGPGQHPIPQTLIFGRDGRLRRHLIGFSPREDAKKLRETVSLLVKEGA